MNENIIIEISFNEKIERENQKFFFKHIWNKNFRELKKAVIYVIIFLVIGFFPLKDFDQSAIPYIFKYVAFLYIGYIFLLLYQYWVSKKKNYKLIEEYIEDFKANNNQMSYITLNDTSLEIRNTFHTFSSVWKKTSYQFVDQHLIIGIVKDRLNFVLTKQEFNNSDYDTLLHYLQKYSTKK